MPAPDQQPDVGRVSNDTTGAVPSEYDDSDDSDYGDSAGDFDSPDDNDSHGSEDNDNRSSDRGDSGYRSHPTHAAPSVTRAAAPRASHVATNHSPRTVARRPAVRSTARKAHTRPMSSGEEQYRNGCRQGYIVEDCSQFDVPHLLQRGINPYL